MDSIIFTRIRDLCSENGITINKLETELGMSQYSIGRWKNSTCPTIDKISKIAKYFGVSIDYLVGVTDIRTPIDTVMYDQDFVSLQRARERMSDRDKTRMMAMLKIGFDYAFDENGEQSQDNTQIVS